MIRNWDRKKVLAGIIFAGIGLTAAILSLRLDVGTATRLGPGGFPLLLGSILAILGLAHVLSASQPEQDRQLGAWEGKASKAVLLIPLSAVVFAVVIGRFGLVPAIIASVLVGGLANPTVRVLELAVLCIALAAFGAGLFVYGLGLPFTLFEIR
jgi:putative tricarboxylic transport membrane protein